MYELSPDDKQKYLDELMQFLAIPSISADAKYKPDVAKAAQFVMQSIKNIGINDVKIYETTGHPIIFCQYLTNPELPTVLVYGHYDVQPAEPLELWHHPPFEPVIIDEKIYARGACDDKGQMYMHIKALQLMINHSEVPCNVKCIFEGEEEIGSENIAAFVHDHKEMLAADVVLISDTAMVANDIPSIDVGLRGITYLEVEVTGPNRDLHSGVYGGAVANPINALCHIISLLHDANKKVAIPGFYDDVLEVPDYERNMINSVPFSISQYTKDLEINEVCGEAGYTSIERTSIRPTLDVNGIWGGYMGEGSKTVLPSKAYAKISMRLVPNQNSEKILQLFINHIQNITPPYIKVKVNPMHGGEPYLMPTTSKAYRAAAMAYEKTFGKKPLATRGGGSVPIVSLFDKVLGAKSVLMGFGLDSDAIHSPNEHFGVYNYFKGIETIPYFYKYYTELT
ncbi:MAG: dipeptidase [Cytophagales bacterium]|nr:dipeptidase [Cytophagales bacterium]